MRRLMSSSSIIRALQVLKSIGICGIIVSSSAITTAAFSLSSSSTSGTVTGTTFPPMTTTFQKSRSSFFGSRFVTLWKNRQCVDKHYGTTASSYGLRRSNIIMMPEGPEVRTVVDQLQGGVGRRLVDIQFLSGRYNDISKRPDGFESFAKTMTPISTTIDEDSNYIPSIDIIQSWEAKGKFIYIILDDGGKRHLVDNNDEDDFQRSIWITLGMTGKFLNEASHMEEPRYARWYIELQLALPSSTKVNDENYDEVDADYSNTSSTSSSTTTNRRNKINKIYYHDQRNFGTLKFCLSKTELDKKLSSLGPDILHPKTNEDDFLNAITKQLQKRKATTTTTTKSSTSDWNICKFLMDQSKISGVGNYILSESLYRANIDPFANLSELNDEMKKSLFYEIQSIARESYTAQGLTRKYGGTFQNVDGNRGTYEFELQCYGRSVCPKGNTIIRETNGPHKRTIWYTQQQLFMSRNERERLSSFSSTSSSADASSSSSSSNNDRNNGNDNDNNNINDNDDDGDIESRKISLISKLDEPSWYFALSKKSEEAVLSSSSSSPTSSSTSSSGPFQLLQQIEDFLYAEQEQFGYDVIYPPLDTIFNAFQLCSLNDVKVVIIGQDPYHTPNVAHGLAFSVLSSSLSSSPKSLPPSLKNIIQEARDDVNIRIPKHGNLQHWARQGVLLLNTVLSVRQGQANSHSKHGWEEFTDHIIEILNDRSKYYPKSGTNNGGDDSDDDGINDDDGIVFLLWGNPAAKKAKIVNESKHVIIRTSHPSPLGATKTSSPFLGSKCFSRTNEALIAMGKTPIDWNII